MTGVALCGGRDVRRGLEHPGSAARNVTCRTRSSGRRGVSERSAGPDGGGTVASVTLRRC
jgi:hypothetical protein